jgi:hypothetical protein
MKDKILETLRHYQGTIAAVVVCIILVVIGFGCQVTTENPFEPGTKVTAEELDIAVRAYADKAALAYADIERQEQIRAAVLEAGLAYAQGGGVNPIGLASTMMGILGLGAIADNRAKDKVIKSKSNALAALADKGTMDAA